jgi:hypothetical protein
MPSVGGVVLAGSPLIATNGVSVSAYKASRFGTPPAFGTAVPGGGADAGPVVSDDAFGGHGAFTITLPTDEPYYVVSSTALGTVWSYYDVVGSSDYVKLAADGSFTLTGTNPRANLTNGALIIDGGFIACQNDGNRWLSFTRAISAVNGLTITNAATGNSPSIAATGTDNNIGLNFSTKGTGSVSFNSGVAVAVKGGGGGGDTLKIAGDGATRPNKFIRTDSAGTFQILNDGFTNPIFQITDPVATPVNFMSISPGATGTSPTIAAAGSDTNVGIVFAPKNSGSVGTSGGNLLDDGFRNMFFGTNTAGGGATIRNGSGGVGLYFGSGAPGAGVGGNGDFYFRQDGGAGTSLYQKRTGSWVATAA